MYVLKYACMYISIHIQYIDFEIVFVPKISVYIQLHVYVSLCTHFPTLVFILDQVIAGPDDVDPRQDITYKPPEYSAQVGVQTSYTTQS